MPKGTPHLLPLLNRWFRRLMRAFGPVSDAEVEQAVRDGAEPPTAEARDAARIAIRAAEERRQRERSQAAPAPEDGPPADRVEKP